MSRMRWSFLVRPIQTYADVRDDLHACLLQNLSPPSEPNVSASPSSVLGGGDAHIAGHAC
jgi:hypothetical protein